jgi:hypothetical protein
MSLSPLPAADIQVRSPRPSVVDVHQNAGLPHGRGQCDEPARKGEEKTIAGLIDPRWSQLLPPTGY